jgi:hypothetical protein
MPNEARKAAGARLEPAGLSPTGANLMPELTCKNPSDATVSKKKKRRGTTAMEYLLMISLILIVCLVAISFFGTTNSGSMVGSANAINKSLKKGS